MTTKIPIATVSYIRRWQRIHRKLTGSLYRPRHLFMARTLALTGMSPRQTAVVTAHLARVEQAFCCDAVAEHVAATLRPALFATVVLESLADGKPMILGGHDGSDGDEAEAVLNALGDGKPTTTPSRKKRKP